MRAHIIQNGVSVNLIEVDSLDFMPGLVDADLHGGGIGDLWDGSAFSAPPPAPPAVPVEVPMASARIVLLRHGFDDAAIRSAIANSAMTTEQKAEALIEWEFRESVRRSSALTLAIGAILALTSEQMDGMFIEAQPL